MAKKAREFHVTLRQQQTVIVSVQAVDDETAESVVQTAVDNGWNPDTEYKGIEVVADSQEDDGWQIEECEDVSGEDDDDDDD